MRLGNPDIAKKGMVTVLPDPADSLFRQLVVAIGAFALLVLAIHPQVMVLRIEDFLVVTP